MKNSISLILRASIFFVLFRFLIAILLIVNKDLSDQLNYNYSTSFYWYSLMFALPLFASLLLSLKLKSKYLKQIGIFLLPFLISATIFLGYLNKNEWGYWFKRPSVFQELKKAKTIISISNITKANGEENFKIDTETENSRELRGRKNLYYGNLDRPIMIFEDNSWLQPDLKNHLSIAADLSPKINRENLEILTKTFLNSEILSAPSNKHYFERANRFRGKVIEFITTENKSYYHLGLTSGEISNDHYPYYEFLIERSKTKKILKNQTYFYDIAGIEGLEYGTLIGIIEFAGLLGIIVFVVLFNGIKRFIKQQVFN